MAVSKYCRIYTPKTKEYKFSRNQLDFISISTGNGRFGSSFIAQEEEIFRRYGGLSKRTVWTVSASQSSSTLIVVTSNNRYLFCPDELILLVAECVLATYSRQQQSKHLFPTRGRIAARRKQSSFQDELGSHLAPVPE